METHIWHAKRFKMQERWGVKYPVRCSDKSDRSTYRLAQHDSAVIMDKSYFSHFHISLTDPASLAQLSIKFENEPKFYERDLVSQGDLICPAQILVYSQ
jgi:ribonuclease P/MRP protein subunit POP1